MANLEKLFTVKIKGGPLVNKEIAQINKAFKAAEQSVVSYRASLDKLATSAGAAQVAAMTKQVNQLSTATKQNIAETKNLTSANTQSASTQTRLTALEKEREGLLNRNAKAHARLTLAMSNEGKVAEQINQRLVIQNRLNREQAKRVAGLQSPYQRLSDNLNRLRKRYKDLAVSGKQDEQQTKRLLSTIQKLDAQLKKVDATVGQSQRKIGNYGNAIGRLRGRFTQLAGAMGISLGLFGAFRLIRSSVSVIRDFELQIATLGGVSRASAEELALLREQAKDLGESTVFTATQVAGLQTEFAKLGFTVPQIQGATQSTLDLAAALGTDLAETAALTGSVIKAYGLDVSQTAAVNDALAASTQRSALDFSKLQTSLATVAPVAKNAGAGLSQTLGLLGTIVDRGVDASTAGTGLRNIFLELGKQGITLNEALDQIANSTDKNATALKLFGKRSSTTAAILAESEDGFQGLAEAIGDASGAAADLAEAKLNTLDGSFKLLRSAWEGFILNANDSTGAASALTKVVRFLAENLSFLVNGLALATTAYGAFRIQQALVTQGTFLNTIATKAQALAQGKASAATGRATVVQRIFNTVLKQNPIIFVAGLVISLVLALRRFIQTNEEASATMETVKRSFNAILDSIRPVIKSIFELGKSFEPLAKLFKKLLDNFIVPLINLGLKRLALQFRLIAGGITAFVSVFSFAFQEIKKIGAGIIDVAKGIFNLDRDQIARGIAQTASSTAELFKGLGKAAKDGFKEGFEGSDANESDKAAASKDDASLGTVTSTGNLGGSGSAESARKAAAAKRKAAAEKARQEELKRLKEAFAARKLEIERAAKEEIRVEQDKLNRINEDARNNAVVKDEAQLNFLNRRREIENNSNKLLTAAENKFKQESKDREYKHQQELTKIAEDERLARRKKASDQLKVIEEENNQARLDLELSFEQRKTEILISNDRESVKRRKLAQLASLKGQAETSAEIIELKQILDAKEKLFQQGLISEQEYTDAKIALQKKANELLAEGYNREAQNFNNNFRTFLANIDSILGTDLGKFGRQIAEGFEIAKQALNDYYNNQRDQIAREKDDRLEQIDLERERLQADAQTAQEREFIDKQYIQKKEAIEKQAGDRLRKIKQSELTISYFTELAGIAAQAAKNPTNAVTAGAAGVAQYAALAGLATVRYALGRNQIARQQFAEGGLPTGGGEIGGRSHSDGGTPFNMGEAERNETAIITTGVNPRRRMVVAGTAKQILSAVNRTGGGRNFAPGAKLNSFELGGFLGAQLNAPVLQDSTLGGNGSEAIDRLEQYITATNNRIDRLRVAISSREMSGAQDNDSKQVEVATIF